MSNEKVNDTMSDTELIDKFEEIMKDETIMFSFMRYKGWEAEQPWICDKHSYGFRRWTSHTLRELMEGLISEYKNNKEQKVEK